MILIQNFLDCPDTVPFIAERIHAQWFADKPGHTVEGLLKRMSAARRNEVPIGLIAFVDGTPAGTVSLVQNDLEERQDLTPWLAGLLVFPDFRGQGVGSALVLALMDEAGRIGLAVMYLYTEKAEFYEALGWKTLSEVQSQPGCWIMSCELQL
jgi:predicted N-acetyltransferase YhbS